MSTETPGTAASGAVGQGVGPDAASPVARAEAQGPDRAEAGTDARGDVRADARGESRTDASGGARGAAVDRAGAGSARTGTAAPAVRARSLVKTYPGGVTALNGMDITVTPGTVLGLLGPNGAGKSTAVKILTTLARPDSGTATVAGHDVLRHPDRVRRAIGVVAQRSGADPVATGRENLILQGRLYGLRGAELNRRADALLERFTLTDAAKRMVQGYSGGMRRRLDVALGLVHRPEVLFLDEPTTGLDPEARTAMWDEIGRLAGDEGLTIVLTTHYLEEADRLAERIAIVDRGRVVVEGTPDELKGELRGDAVHVELRADGDRTTLTEALAGLTGLHDLTLDGRRVSVRADDGAAAVPALLAALERAGAAVAAATVARPSLDDVYLRYAGRRFSEAEAAEPADRADRAEAVPDTTDEKDATDAKDAKDAKATGPDASGRATTGGTR